MHLPAGYSLKPAILLNAAKTLSSLALSHALKRPVVWGQVISVMIEPISRCNFLCPLCPAGARSLKRELGTMTLDNFKTILNHLGPYVRTLALWNQGEPTINDALPEMVAYAHSKNIYTVISTNGSLLHRRRLIERLIAAGLNELIFAIDGLTQETYGQYRIGGHLDVVVANMQAARATREASGKKTPRIVMQWLPMKHNEHEIPDLRKKARAWGADSLEIKTTQIYSNAEAEKFLPDADALRRYEQQGKCWETKRRYQSCRRLWFSTMIDWNGNVVPCCFDKDEDFVMGNTLHEDFKTIWHGSAYNALRTRLLTRGRELDICRNCTEGLRSFYLPLTKLERSTPVPTDKGIPFLEEPPV